MEYRGGRPRSGRLAHRWPQLGKRYKTYRDGAVVGFVPALDRHEVRQISGRFLSQDDRVRIADVRHAGVSMREIAAAMGRKPSTISRELGRNTTPQGGSRPVSS